MDPKRLLLMGAVLLAVVGSLYLYTKSNQPAEPSATTQPATQPAAQPADAAEAPQASPESTSSAEVAETPEAPAEVASVPTPTPAPADGAKAQWIGSDQPPAETVTLGSLDAETDYMFQVELTNQGAAVNAVRLVDHFVTAADRHLYDKDPAGYEQARLADPAKYKGHYAFMTPIDGTRSLATRRVDVWMLGRETPDGKPIRLALTDLGKRRWMLTARDANSVTFSYELNWGVVGGQAEPVLRIDKTYRLDPQTYSLDVTYRLRNLSGGPLRVSLDQTAATGLNREGVRMDNRQAAFGRIDAKDRQVEGLLEKFAKLTKSMEGPQKTFGRSDDAEPVVWVGMTNKYFASLVYLHGQTDKDLDAPSLRADFYVEQAGDGDFITGLRVGGRRGDAESSDWGIRIEPGSESVVALDVFAGPKDRRVFTDDDSPLHRPLYKTLDYIATLSSGFCFCTSDALAFLVMDVLKIFAGVLFGNYGLAIILLVFVVRLALHPLAKKSQLSTMKMQKLGPEMKKLQAKHANDKEALSRETMKFYKEQGATPLLGCLPMFLQMPIWIALYTGINASIELRHAAFLPVWITDLAAPDALITFAKPIPLVFTTLTSFNLLPLLLTVAMFLQTKLMPQMAQAAATGDDKAKQQQKMMRYMMPGMMLMFFYSAPSGLTLYIMASTAAGILDSYLIKRHIRAKEAVETARETTVSVPGKAARSVRPKKPKGPNWFKQS